MKTVDILIFGGQSNMQGQSECLSENEIVPRALEYRYLSDSLIPLRNPVGENVHCDGTRGDEVTPATDVVTWLSNHALGAACYGHTNLVPAFCRAYAETADRDVIAVHAAKGSTCVAQWLPGGAGYKVLRDKACAASTRAREGGCEIGRIYFVWLQGESDALMSTSTATYKAQLNTLWEALHADVGVDAFGIIRVGRFAGDARDDEILRAQDEICREQADFWMLTEIAVELNRQPEYMNPTVAGHYSAKGLEMLGRVAGEALAKAAKG